jgi:hypothetical protein
MTRPITTLVSIAGAAVAANAQTGGVATYSLQFSNGTNVISLLPGQSTTVSVFVSFNPGLGAPYGTAPPLQGFVLGANNGAFSITGTPSGTASGTFGVLPGTGHPSLMPPYNFLPGIATNQGTSTGLSHDGVIWGHAFLFIQQWAFNPAKVWEGTFTVTSAGNITFAFTGLAATGIDVSSGPVSVGAIPWVAEFATSPGVGGMIVIPAPASLALLGLGGVIAVRRRRGTRRARR